MKLNILYNHAFLKGSSGKKELRNAARSVIETVLKGEKMKIHEISLIFCDDAFIRAYNKEYLGHDYETDIITFHDENESGLPEGELLISIDTVKENSVKYKAGFERELLRVIIHGTLHLCGYKDKSVRQKKEIRKKENFYLNQIF